MDIANDLLFLDLIAGKRDKFKIITNDLWVGTPDSIGSDRREAGRIDIEV